mmetsp:Transcript_7403/g.16263  ORF Transcript_7403/g.16263 Transcript_7403/m.16263 type:complete len:174 (+) Transcript_7403:67-588(+)
MLGSCTVTVMTIGTHHHPGSRRIKHTAFLKTASLVLQRTHEDAAHASDGRDEKEALPARQAAYLPCRHCHKRRGPTTVYLLAAEGFGLAQKTKMKMMTPHLALHLSYRCRSMQGHSGLRLHGPARGEPALFQPAILLHLLTLMATEPTPLLGASSAGGCLMAWKRGFGGPKTA